MQGSLHSVWVLNRAETVDYVWVKARNGKFSFLLMEKVGKAIALSQTRKIAFLSCSLFYSLFSFPPSLISKIYVELMSRECNRCRRTFSIKYGTYKQRKD